MQPKIEIRAGSKKIGDKHIDGIKRTWTITSLGKPFTKFIPDEDACCYGLMPGNDYRISMQNAYLTRET